MKKLYQNNRITCDPQFLSQCFSKINVIAYGSNNLKEIFVYKQNYWG